MDIEFCPAEARSSKKKNNVNCKDVLLFWFKRKLNFAKKSLSLVQAICILETHLSIFALKEAFIVFQLKSIQRWRSKISTYPENENAKFYHLVPYRVLLAVNKYSACFSKELFCFHQCISRVLNEVVHTITLSYFKTRNIHLNSSLITVAADF